MLMIGNCLISGLVDRLSFIFGRFFAEAKKAAPGRKASKHTAGVNSGSKKHSLYNWGYLHF